MIFETLFETLWVSNPIRPRSAASRNRVTAKRSQGARVIEPRNAPTSCVGRKAPSEPWTPGARGMRAGGFPGNPPRRLHLKDRRGAGTGSPSPRPWTSFDPASGTAGKRGGMGRGVGVSHSTAEAGELRPHRPRGGKGAPAGGTVGGKDTHRGWVPSPRHDNIAELARQALGMAVARLASWTSGYARRVAKLSVDAAEPARPDLWGARVSNYPTPPPGPSIDDSGRRVAQGFVEGVSVTPRRRRRA